MKNITVSVDDETHRLARIRAAELDTSVSALVKHYLRRLVRDREVEAALESQVMESEHERRRRLLDDCSRTSAPRAADSRRPTTCPARHSTSVKRFVDTNILIYAVSPSPHEAEKRRIAQDLLGRDDLVLSVQVLQEFYHQVTRPTRPHALTHAQAMGFIRIIDAFPVQELTFDLFLAAVSITRRFRLSYWTAQFSPRLAPATATSSIPRI